MEDSQVEGKSSSQVTKPPNEQSGVPDTAKVQSMTAEKSVKVPHNIAIQPKTASLPHIVQKPQSLEHIAKGNSNTGKITDNGSLSITKATGGGNSRSPKSVSKAPSQPIIMPKHINTPDGTILFNTNTPVGKSAAKPKKATDAGSKGIAASSKGLSKQPINADTRPNAAKGKSSPQVSRTATPIGVNKLQPSAAASQMSRSSSVQPAIKVASPYQTMQRTSSVPIAKNTPVSAPIPKPSTPIQPHPNPGVYFHPIAIKPKPIQPLPAKGRSKSSSFSRLSSASSIHSSKDQLKPSDSSITLSTSRNWVLPPRPKTKKASKKKEKRPIQRVSTTNSTDLKNVASTSQKSSHTALSPKVTVAKKATSATLYPQKAVTGANLSSSNSKVKAEKEISLIKDAAKSKMAPTRAVAPIESNRKVSKGEVKQKECTGCTTCVAPGIRSVYLEPSTGKVSINAQIHSNINLYTNDEGELEVQLQHVTRENDNLKKILLKLNKEIQNLKLVKKKEESSLIGSSGSSGVKTSSGKNIAATNMKVEPSEGRTTSNINSTNQGSSSKLVLDYKKTEIEPIVRIKQENTDIEMDVDDDLAIAKSDVQPNTSDFLPDMLTASTIDPVNLSYNLDSKRQKLATEDISNHSIRPSLVQQPSDLSLDTLTTAKTKPKKRTEKTAAGTAKAKTKPKTVAKSKSTNRAAQKLSSESPSSSPNNTLATSVTSNTSIKSFEQTKEPKPSTVKKEYHSCGVCEIGQKCVCFETQTLSIAATIAQALSRGGVNLLGLGGINNTSINTLNSMSNINGLSTLTAILKREEIMKRLKDDDKKTLTNILKSESTKKGTTKKDKASLNTILGGLNGLPMDDNICGINTINDVAMVGMRNDLAKASNINPAAVHDDDDELLQMIDAELLLDPTPLVNPILLKKDRTTSSTNISTLKANTAESTSSGMKRSESKNSQHSMGTNTEFFGRGSLMDFNAFNGGDPMIDDDAMMFESNSLSMGNASANAPGDISADIDKILMEPIDDTDEFMIY